MRRPFSLAISWCITIQSVCGVSWHSSLESSLQKILDRASNLSLGTGITLGVSLPDRTISLTAGKREMHNDNAAELLPTDTFALGSATKMYTAASILRLVDAGKISLDDQALPLFDKLWTKLNGTSIVNLLGPQIKNVTVRHLLGMRSGIPDFDTLESRSYQFEHPHEDLGPVKEMIFTPRKGQFDCDPGTCGEYSSSNYEILGLILAQQAHTKSWDDYNQAAGLPEDLLATMPNTAFAVHGACSKYTDVHAYSSERTPPYDVYNLSCTNGWACGNVISNGADAAVFVRALLGNSERVVKAKTRQEMLKTQEFSRGWSQGLRYGLGIMDLSHLVNENATTFFGHGGETYGFNGEVGYSMLHDFGLAVFANTENTYLVSRVIPETYQAIVASMPKKSTVMI